MRFKKQIAILLLLSMLCGVFASCKKKEHDGSISDDSNGASDGTETSQPPEGDTWMDIWNQDPEFEVLTDDKSKDTRGTLPDGSWFDSFTLQRNLFWTNKNNYATRMDFEEGMLHYEAADFSGTTHEAIITRSVDPTENFEVEFRLKIDYYGNDNGVYVGYNGVRVVIYFAESFVRFNRDRGGSEPGGDIVYTDIGYDWHTYRIRVNDRIAKVYIDGVYLTSFVPESWGGENGELGLFAYPSNATNAARGRVEYMSYTVLEEDNVKISSPTAGAVCGEGVSDVAVSVKLSATAAQASDSVSYYLNGLYAGQGAVQSSDLSAKMTFQSLKPGVYSVYAVCGDYTSAERVFTVEEPSATKNAVYTTKQLLQSSYILKFNVSGSGTVTAGDGMYPLSLSFGSHKLSYSSYDGKKNILMGDGAYIVLVDGGSVWLYYNGKLALSYRLPYGACESAVTVSGGISGLTVEAHNGTFYAKDLSEKTDLSEDVGAIGYNYALEFEYTKGSEADLILTDGIYSLDLHLAADGAISALMAPQKVPYRQAICEAGEGTAVYRVQVSLGIAQIYYNNVWLASWRMPESVAKRNLYFSGGGMGKVQIREINDKFYYAGNASDSDWNSYFGTTGDLSEIGATCLEVYSQNTAITAEIALTSASSGSIYLLARYFNGKGIFAGYDFDAKCFKIGNSLTALQAVDSSVSLSANGTAKLSLSVMGSSVVLTCNGTKIAETSVGDVNGWGNAGYLDLCDGAAVKSFSYEGDGNPLCGTTTALIPNDWTSCFFEFNGTVYAGGEFGAYRSKDDGKTFTDFSLFGSYSSWNMLVLKSGKLLSLVRTGSLGSLRYVAYVSSDNGLTFDGPYPVNADTNAYRFTMNGKVMQTSSGRIIFVSGETENEYMGQLWVYYSDNDGVTWTKSDSEFNQKTTGMNLQEGMVVELDDGLLRMYARNDCGYIVYSESTDGGVTWGMEMQFSNFPSTVCAFGVNKDPYTGAIYMCWEYNCANDSNLVQYPRTRVGLAVSYDNARTWYYVGDIDELNSLTSSTWMHMNGGVWFTEDAVLATTAKSINGQRYNYIVRIPKENLVPMARFNSLHVLREDPYAYREGMKLFANGVLAISSETGRVYASGVNYELDAVNGKRTMISAEIIADFLNGVLTLDGNRAVIRVGAAEYVFTAGSQTASVAGEEKAMTFAAVLEDGTMKVSLEDLHNALGLTARCSESGAMVFTVSSDPIRVDYLLSMTGIW